MDMSETSRPTIDKVDLMIANARLRDELEPYRDDSIEAQTTRRMPLHKENEYLESILAWERAPALPIAQWFEPELRLPAADSLSDQEVAETLDRVIAELYSKNIVLSFTDHLSNRELYQVIVRDILPSCEKKVDMPGKVLEWRCIEDDEIWLSYYADAVERRRYQEEFQTKLPPVRVTRFPRRLPGFPKGDR